MLIRTEIAIAAPPGICFDLARSVDAHVESARSTGERAVAGVTSGLLNLDDWVTWRARHFGVTLELTSRITVFERPGHFRDEMVRGAFRRFTHDHFFEETANGTRMVDVLDVTAPFGLLGSVAERLVLTGYLRRFLEERARVLKRLAESDAGRRFLSVSTNPPTA